MDYFFYRGEAEHYFLGMGGMQSLSSQGGMVGRLLLLVEKEVLVRREGWEVDILVTLLIYGVFIESYKLF